MIRYINGAGKILRFRVGLEPRLVHQIYCLYSSPGETRHSLASMHVPLGMMKIFIFFLLLSPLGLKSFMRCKIRQLEIRCCSQFVKRGEFQNTASVAIIDTFMHGSNASRLKWLHP